LRTCWARLRCFVSRQLVKKLNQAAREGKFQIELFKDYTGKTVDELWAEFADSLREKEKAASVSPAVK
jgi:hypothetical protein